MSEVNLSVGQRVEVTGKQVCGTIAFVGTTSFASGKWIGVILDEPKGKNNGTVQDISYFECPDLHGIFLRQTQLSVLDESGNDAEGNVVSGSTDQKISPSSATVKKITQKSPGSPSVSRKSGETAASKGVPKSRLPSITYNNLKVPGHTFLQSNRKSFGSMPTLLVSKRRIITNGKSSATLSDRNQTSCDAVNGGYQPSLLQSRSNSVLSGNEPLSSLPSALGSSRKSFTGSAIPRGVTSNAANNSVFKNRSTRKSMDFGEGNRFYQNMTQTPGNTIVANHKRRISEIKNTPASKLNFSATRNRLSLSLFGDHEGRSGSRKSIANANSQSSIPLKKPRLSLIGSESVGNNLSDALTPRIKSLPTSNSESSKTDERNANVESASRRRVEMTFLLSPSLDTSTDRVISAKTTRLPVAGKEKEIPKSLQTSPTNSKLNLNVTTTAGARVSDGGNTGVSASKRSSFVETLAEPIVPQYTPGTPLTPAMSVSMYTTALSSTLTPTNVEDRSTAIHTIDTLRTEVKDLTEKLETLKAKRAADQEKLRELDKLRLQVETLTEFKGKVLEAQSGLQRDLKKAKQEARDATEAKERHDEEIAELSEAVEMATLDKEMAEEKAETLQLEFEQANEKIAALTTELNALKEEAAGGGGGSSDVMNSVQVKQMQAENARLKEALIKLRDSSAHEKHQHQKTLKEAETHKAEVIELSRTKERLESRCNELEAQISDLQEQNDAALGAEEMVENLTEKNLNLEEKVGQLAEAVADLEALQDVNDQLQESAKELEMELREELQHAIMANQNISREKEAFLETLSDRESTIMRFRDLVQKLKDENELLQRNLEIESSKSIPGLAEALDFKEIFSKSKAQTTAIDLELRRLEVKEAKLHVQYLNSFMPDGFIKRGGDHDSLLVLLLIPRLIGKVELLLSQVNEKLVPPSLADGISSFLSTSSPESISSSPDVERYAFSCQFTFLLYALQSELHRWDGALNTCSTDAFLKVGLIYNDLNIQEIKAVDFYLELLRKNQLDENIPLDNLERCIQAFQNSYASNLGEEHIEPSTLVSDLCLASVAACDCVIVDVHRLLFMIRKNEKESNVSALLQDLKTISESLRQLSKKTKRYLPEPPKQPPVTSKLQSQLLNDSITLAKVVKILQEACKQAVRHAGTSADGIPSTKLEEYLYSAMDICDSGVEGGVGFKEVMKEWLTTSLMTITDLALLNEAPTLPKDKPPKPVSLRAQAVKAELDQTRNLKIQLEDKEVAMKELKQLILAKKEELSEAQIRKELAEKKLSVATKENEMTIEKLTRKIEDLTTELQRKKREFEATLEHYQQLMESLESEKGELKDKLLNISKKSLLDGLARSVNTPLQSPSHSPAQFTSTPIGAIPPSAQPTSNLIEYTQFLQKQNWRLRSEEVSRIIKSLPPLDLGPSQDELEENRKLYQEYYKLKGDYFATVRESIKLLDPKIPKGRKRYLHELILQKRANIVNQIHEMKLRVRDVKSKRGISNVISVVD